MEETWFADSPGRHRRIQSRSSTIASPDGAAQADEPGCSGGYAGKRRIATVRSRFFSDIVESGSVDGGGRRQRERLKASS